MSPYYTTLDCAQGHYSVCTDPALCRPLTNSGCMYTSYFTSMVTVEVKVEQSSNLRAEWSLEMGVEWSSDLEVGWNLEQQRCEMGHPLTVTMCYVMIYWRPMMELLGLMAVMSEGLGFNICVAPFLNICVLNLPQRVESRECRRWSELSWRCCTRVGWREIGLGSVRYHISY